MTSPGPNAGIRAWARDLLSGHHPTFHPGDVTIVEGDLSEAAVPRLAARVTCFPYPSVCASTCSRSDF